MRTFMTAALCSSLTLLVFLSALPADETTVPLDKVPKAVMDAVKAKYPGAKLLGASTEKDGDKTVYEISLKFKGHHHDVTLEPEGTIVSIEKEIAAKDLPAVVAKAVNSKYPKATWKRVEELSKGDGSLTGYEVVLVSAAKDTVEVVLDPQGKITQEGNKGKENAK